MNSREIKFRAWDTTHKKMLDRVLAGPGDPCSIVYDEKRKDWVNFDDACGVIMQSTGLKDCKGKMIYEGDIVNNVTYTFNGVVFFENGSFWVREYLSHVDEGLYGDREKETRWSINLDWEIIGNIYENPELIAEED